MSPMMATIASLAEKNKSLEATFLQAVLSLEPNTFAPSNMAMNGSAKRPFLRGK